MTMKAIVARSFGDPAVLELADVDVPEPGEGEVRVAVHAAGLNPVDAQNRADGSWAGIDLPWIPGYEVAGVVDHVGAGVDDLRVGDRVMGMTHFRGQTGGYAEFATLRATALARVPATVPLSSAAATPVAAGTALEVVRRLRLEGGERLLVLGASGGVGSFLLQLATARGVDVVAVGRSEHHPRMLELGAMACVDYTERGAIATVHALAGGEMDAIADLVGGTALGPWLSCLRESGRIASIETPELDLGDVLDANLDLHGVLLTNDGRRTRTIARLLGRGRLTVHIAHTLPLAEAAEAHRILDGGHSGGKIVLIPDGR
jgi:NADPH2:quinone reductase